MADQSRIYFNSNINVDVVKVTKDTSLTLQDAIAQRKKMGKKPLLYNDFTERIEAEYFPPLAKDREAREKLREILSEIDKGKHGK